MVLPAVTGIHDGRGPVHQDLVDPDPARVLGEDAVGVAHGQKPRSVVKRRTLGPHSAAQAHRRLARPRVVGVDQLEGPGRVLRLRGRH